MVYISLVDYRVYVFHVRFSQLAYQLAFFNFVLEESSIISNSQLMYLAWALSVMFIIHDAGFQFSHGFQVRHVHDLYMLFSFHQRFAYS